MEMKFCLFEGSFFGALSLFESFEGVESCLMEVDFALLYFALIISE